MYTPIYPPAAPPSPGGIATIVYAPKFTNPVLWSPALVDTFNRADTAFGGAGSTNVGNGWIDVQGNVYKITSGQLVGTEDAVDGSQYRRDILKAASTYAGREQKIVFTVPPGGLSNPAGHGPFGCLRIQASKDYYGFRIGFDGTNGFMNVFAVVSGTANSIGGTPPAWNVAYDATKTYQVTFAVTDGETSGTAYLTLEVADVATGNLYAAWALTDTAASLNNSTGVPGLVIFNGGSAGSTTFNSVTLYTSIPELRLARIGDSISANTPTGDFETPVARMALMMEGVIGSTVTMLDLAIAGTTTADWMIGGASGLATKITTMAAAGIQVCSIMLGANDQNSTFHTTKATFKSNLSAVCTAILASIPKVILHVPYYIMPGASSGNWDAAGVPLAIQYGDAIRELANGTTILLGDTTLFETIRRRTSDITLDNVHPNKYGADVVAGAQGVAELRALGYL